MSATAEFRLLTEQSDVLAEITDVIYRDVEQFGKLSVLCSDHSLLQQLSDQLWVNARDNFVTYQFASDPSNTRVNVLLASEIYQVRNTKVLININYLLAPQDLNFRRITEIVLPADETVDKARIQYKMYRSAGLQVSHLQR